MINSLRDHLLIHLDACYNLARWLTRSEQDAKDVVQEAFLRALKYESTFEGEDYKPWLLKIVRNTCFTWLKANKDSQTYVTFDDLSHSSETSSESIEDLLVKKTDIIEVRRAIESLPLEYREIVILRELENLSYESIADVIGIPMGTVMSRLSRGRAQLTLLLKSIHDDRRTKNENR